MLKSIRVLFLTVLPLTLVSCIDIEGFNFGNSQRFKEDFHSSYPLQPGGRISLENMNGSVEISGWEKDTVDIVGTKYANSESVLKDMKIDVVASPGSVIIRTLTPPGPRGSFGAKYILRVPKKTVLDRITSSNGSIHVESIDGSAKLKTSNGSVRIAKLNGPLDVQTSNASVEVNDQTGDTTVQTSNGSIRAEDIRGSFEATTSNASIHASQIDPEPHKLLRLETSNGKVELTLDHPKDNDLRIKTSNASILLRLPAGAGGQLRARTSNSSISTDFDVTVKSGQMSKSHMEGTIGSGGPLLELITSNGSIKIQKI
jgi:hypothetical protein